MNYLDIILIIPLAYGLVQGLRKGLIKEIAGLLAIILGIYLARYFSLPVSQVLTEMTGWASNICTPLAYAHDQRHTKRLSESSQTAWSKTNLHSGVFSLFSFRSLT